MRKLRTALVASSLFGVLAVSSSGAVAQESQSPSREDIQLCSEAGFEIEACPIYLRSAFVGMIRQRLAELEGFPVTTFDGKLLGSTEECVAYAAAVATESAG